MLSSFDLYYEGLVIFWRQPSAFRQTTYKVLLIFKQLMIKRPSWKWSIEENILWINGTSNVGKIVAQYNDHNILPDTRW